MGYDMVMAQNNVIRALAEDTLNYPQTTIPKMFVILYERLGEMLLELENR